MSADERRYRIGWVSEQTVWDLFLTRRCPDVLELPILEGVPADCVVVRVCHNWERRAFGFMLEHHSFDPVPEGEKPPSVIEPLRWEMVRVLPEPGQPPTGPRFYDVAAGLIEENARLRGVFADLLDESRVAERAYQQGKADGVREERGRVLARVREALTSWVNHHDGEVGEVVVAALKVLSLAVARPGTPPEGDTGVASRMARALRPLGPDLVVGDAVVVTPEGFVRAPAAGEQAMGRVTYVWPGGRVDVQQMLPEE